MTEDGQGQSQPRARGKGKSRGSRRGGRGGRRGGAGVAASDVKSEATSSSKTQHPRAKRGRSQRGGGRGARRGGANRSYKSPEGEMNGHLQSLQDQMQLVADTETRTGLESECAKLLDLRKSFYLAKGNEKREEASSILHQQLLPSLREAVSKLEAADKRDPMQESCLGASNKQAENLFVYDNTSVGSLSSTEADDDEDDDGDDNKVSTHDKTSHDTKEAKSSKQETKKQQQQQQQQQQRGTRADEVGKRKRPAKGKQAKWWHSLTDIDPISMDSLAELPYPPFAITVRVNRGANEGESTEVKQYFDGKMLAHYIVSTGNFSNPNTRQPLTRQICQSLDQYLLENRLPPAKVTDAFDLSKAIRVQQQGQRTQGGSADEGMERRAAVLRRQATVLMNSMFNFSSRDSATQQQNLQAHIDAAAEDQADHGYSRQRRLHAVVHRDGNLRVIDDDDWQVEEASAMDDTVAFPELPAGSANAAAATAYERPRGPVQNDPPVGVPRVTEPRAPSWPGRAPGHGQAQAVPTNSSFDTSQNAAGPRPVTTSTAWGASSASVGPTMASIVSAAPRAAPAPSASASSASRGGLSVLGSASGRPRLSLAPRSGATATAGGAAMQTLRASQANRSVFGNALPREQVLASQGIDPRSREMHDGRVALAASLDGLLCPYTPDFVSQARRVGMDLVGRIETELVAFLRAPTSVRTKALPVMRTEARRFFHKLAQDYYGLQTSSIDPEPNRHIVVHKTTHASEPEMSVIQAILQFGNLLSSSDNELSGAPAALTRQRSHAALGSSSVALWGVSELAGGGRISSNAVSTAIEPTVRRSAFHVRTLDAENVILEFSDKATARKTLAMLKSQRENVLGPISWKQVQWWPAPDDWALMQLRLHSSSTSAENRRKREERRLQSQAARIQRQAQNALNTGWNSDDDDNDKSHGRSSRTASSRLQQSSRNRGQAGGASFQAASQSTLWDQLADSDSE